MKKILIFAGTSEGRKLSECMASAGIAHTVCVATEYGEIVLKKNPLVEVHCGRMDREEMTAFLKAGKFAVIVDATHPYATAVTENIMEAVNDMEILYLRLQRETDVESDYGKISFFQNNETCASALESIEGNILLTTGSKELSVYCAKKEVKERLYVRILPGLESLKLCMEQGIMGKQIIALQGPFSEEMNEAILHQYQIKCLVTKKSGRAGGYQEKLEAAERAGIPVYVVGEPKQQEGYSFGEVCHKLESICGKKIKQYKHMKITLAGVGMGSQNTLTKEVSQEIENANVLLGAERMIAQYQPRVEKMPFYTAAQIIPYLKEAQKSGRMMEGGRVVILFSGDSGFYSGCQSVYQALQAEIEAGGLEASVNIMPGISSVSYFASCIGEGYQETAICSIHGKEIPNLAEKIRREKKLFLLMSGVKDLNRLGKLLLKAGLEHCEIMVGYQLSYPQQKIMKLTPKECCLQTEEGLYIGCIKNKKAEEKELTHGRLDEVFIRGKVPMTKEEVREVSICKLKLHKGAVVYDIGSGTGSIAIEIAGLSEDIQVYALEKKEEAVSLIQMNKEKFGLENVEIIQAIAPDGLSKLPPATHAFIGGSGGNLQKILSILYEKNPSMRVVINAISLETICEIKKIISTFSVEGEEIIQLQVSKAKSVGAYHLMQAENPVWICSFRFKEVISHEV